MFSRMGSAAFKKDLTNIQLLCARLGNPHHQLKTIHVAGTNGKGSVSHMLAAILQTAGYKTGLYTSPHLYDFRERIKVNGEMADQNFVVTFVERIRPLIEEIQPSFFEITVVMAFEYFLQQKTDIAIIEVGLGGRLDSTNIIQPELSIITNIGWDHMNMLGDSLESIAKEKAGIIKEEIPVVIGEKNDETSSVFTNAALQKNAPLYFAEEHYVPVNYSWTTKELELEIMQLEEERTMKFELDLPGIYQLKNICTVLQAVDVLNESGHYSFIDHQTIKNALRSVKQLTGLHGRWEVIQTSPLVILEVAHNKNGVAEMLRHLDQMEYDQLHLVIGMVKDKDVGNVLQMLPSTARYYFTQAHIPRAMDATTLQSLGSNYSLEGSTFKDVNLALENAIANAGRDDVIIVCGSIFLVAEVHRPEN